MQQKEIDEISDAFLEAWTDYFGDTMYYVPFILNQTPENALYHESKVKQYDYAHKVLFHGTLRETPAMDESTPTGGSRKKDYEITLVAKEIIDKGVLGIDIRSIIQYVDRFGTEHLFRIYDDYGKVQFSSNKIFFKLKVVPNG